MDELSNVYIQECREQLAEREAGLLRLEQAPGDNDNIDGIFRAAHTIKGGAGVIECHFIEHFTDDERTEIELQPACFDFRKIKNIVDQVQKGA